MNAVTTLNDGTRRLSRYAREDQYPSGAGLRDAARDSVIRYTQHYGLDFRWVHDQAGELWVWEVDENGLFESWPTGIRTFRSEVEIVGGDGVTA